VSRNEDVCEYFNVPHFLTTGTESKKGISFTPRPLYHLGSSHRGALKMT